MEIDLQKDAWLTYLALLVIAALALTGLAFIGRNVTPLDAATGQARRLTWDDWRILQARRAHNAELSSLRRDLNDIAQMARQLPDPVSAQILRARITQHTQSGQPTLEAARASLQNAADALALWAAAQLERDVLLQTIQAAESALKQ